MYKVNEIIKDVLIEELSYEGYGVFRGDKSSNQVLFVDNALPNQKVDVKIYWANKQIAFGEPISQTIIKENLNNDYNEALYKSMAAPLLPYTYEEQLKFKFDILNNLVKRNLPEEVVVENIVASKKETHYRNKITLQVEKTNNKYIFGFYKKRTHKLIEQPELTLANEEMCKAFESFKKFINNNKINLNINKVTFRYSQAVDKIQIIFDLNNQDESASNKIKDIFNWIDNLENIVICFKEKILVVLDRNNKLNKNWLEYKLRDKKFIVSWDSFFQVNDFATEDLYDLVKKEIKDQRNIIDAYSGVGSIGIYIGNDNSKIYLIETNKNASINACKNIEINNLDKNKVFSINAKTEDILRNAEIAKQHGINVNKIDTIIFDPPRSGIEGNTLNTVIEANIKKIIYVSCNPHTLVRDLKILSNNGYKIKKITPVDMFPQTAHVEAVAVIYKD
ncbi:23S rRNA (uracil(1939)-C(5))-methyltransferase RlmD [[Mycoplasma] falconis]|uniref:23S rRNA (Uracil(1939)-C(5))-methyltransferase RlmD n=1 Tax=[Mycoplasma] falconis TaxID=92403 RepID=A0A501XBU2_9BACT|nr:23S rRNA (uracil(1939)-C(5))-methyltransferase RlmD [[Mycoplasma] falconis]TPE57764.1 23S rRNA (uracil(1939)-C(5))-methyltransferase RlmD [[Mycoplasma] falconis]